MKIRKKYNVESAHIVRNCTSERCSHSIHGHSAVIEVIISSRRLDNAGMVYDFGLMKGAIKSFIDSMDHSYLLCSKDSESFKNNIKEMCDRWIELPFNPSAECLAMYIHHGIQHILDMTVTKNGEGILVVDAVRYHETETGYAESCSDDMLYLWQPAWWNAIEYSEAVKKDWDQGLWTIFEEYGTIINPAIEQQIELDNE